jgi:uncharacterized protein (DUF1015 family)
MQDELYRKHLNNVVRLILGKIKNTDDESDNRYTRAGDLLELWLRGNILIKDEEPGIYIYSQKYKLGKKYIDRMGFISLLKLDLNDKKAVLPHENTLKAPKVDRLSLMRSVKGNLSPVFMLYEDDKHKVVGILKNFTESTKPFIDVTMDDVRNRVWNLTGRDAIRAIEKLMAQKDVFIADGHHRYETAVNYATEVERSGAPQVLKDNSKYLMTYFCELDDKTLTILPTHRLIKDIAPLKKEDIIKKLEKIFVVKKMSSENKLLAGLSALKKHHAFGMYLGGDGFYVIRLKKEGSAAPLMGKNSRDWKDLDVAVLHLFVIQNVLGIRDEDDNIEFVKDPDEAFRAVDNGKFKIAFILNPTKVSQMKKVAERGEKMPRKATYFYPKPLSGLVINKFN